MIKDLDYTCLSYKENIAEWIKQCIKEVALNPIIRESLIQYLHLIKYLNNQTTNQPMTEELTGLINTNLEAAFTIKNNIRTATNNLLEKFKEDVLSIEEIFRSEGYECNYYVDLNKAYSGFRFQKKNSKYASIAFQFYEYGKFFNYGIATFNDPVDKPIPLSLRTELQSKTGVNTKNAWWPVKFEFEAPYNKNWEQSHEPWEAIQTGRMKEIIIDKVNYMIKLLGNTKL